ncbi:MAG: hypothetical protein PUC06_07000 [Oscillospiraceae bacterium]|nr:hypothetical protein [Oscillospiraceae bacterium]
MFPFFGVFLMNAAGFLIVFGSAIRRFSAAAVVTNGAMLLVINFALIYNGIKGLIPSLSAEVLMLVFAAILVGITIPLAIKRPNMLWACLMFALAFGVLTVMCFVFAAIGSGKNHEDAKAPVMECYEEKTFSGEKPNVYFFLFDEYGGYECLEHYYKYDNSPFYDAMEQRGFTVTKSCHNTESILTVTLVPNLMNMNYVAEDSMSVKTRDAMLVMPNFFRTFRDNGYAINLINHVDYFGTEGCTVLTENQSRRTISDYLLKNSLYHYLKPVKDLLNMFIKADYVATYTDALFNAMDAGRSCTQFVGEGPTLTMGYFQTPHAPTILDKNGKLVDNYENVGWCWGEFQYYLGQLEFVNSFILEAVDNIIANDPDALIILQSDHGVRQAKHYYELGWWTTYDAPTENLYQQNIMNFVRYRGETFPIEGEIGINSLRIILNQVFGTDYEMIEPIYYTEGEFEKK